MNKLEALKAIKRGAIAGFIVTGMTLVIVLLAFRNNAHWAYYKDPWIFLDIVGCLLCAIGMLFKMRSASIIILVLFIAGKLNQLVDHQLKPASIILGCFFIYLFFQAMRGAFVYHRIEKSENPNYKSTPKWLFYLGITLGLLWLALILIGIMLPDDI